MKISFAATNPADMDVLAFVMTKDEFSGFEFPLEHATQQSLPGSRVPQVSRSC
jgi:hypothetical protein